MCNFQFNLPFLLCLRRSIIRFLPPPATEVEDTAASDEDPADPTASQPPRTSQTSQPSQQDDEEAEPSGITPTSSSSSHSKKSDKSFNPVDEVIMSMVRTMKENQDLKKTVNNVLDV